MDHVQVNANGSGATTDVRTRIQEMVAGGELSQAQAAREAGLSGSALSRWLQGKYEGDNAAVERKLQTYLDNRDRQTGFLLPEEPGWQATKSAERIMAGLTYAHLAADVTVIYGGAGLGKSRTARHYADNRPNVWLATMSPATSTPAAALEELYLSLDIRESAVGSGASRMQRTAILRLRGTRGLLIVDEAQHLSVQALETVRTIHDAAGVGLALIGNETVYGRLTGGSRKADFAQLFSRIGKRVALNKPLKSDVETLAAAWGIDARESVAFLVDVAKQHGALRGCVKTLKLGAMVAAGQGETLGLDHLKAAWRDLGGTE